MPVGDRDSATATPREDSGGMRSQSRSPSPLRLRGFCPTTPTSTTTTYIVPGPAWSSGDSSACRGLPGRRGRLVGTTPRRCLVLPGRRGRVVGLGVWTTAGTTSTTPTPTTPTTSATAGTTSTTPTTTDVDVATSTATTTYIASRGSFFTAGITSRLLPRLSLKQLTRPARLTQPSSRPSGATESEPGQCLISFGTN